MWQLKVRWINNPLNHNHNHNQFLGTVTGHFVTGDILSKVTFKSLF